MLRIPIEHIILCTKYNRIVRGIQPPQGRSIVFPMGPTRCTERRHGVEVLGVADAKSDDSPAEGVSVAGQDNGVQPSLVLVVVCGQTRRDGAQGLT